MAENGGILKEKRQLWHFKVRRQKRWHFKGLPFILILVMRRHRVGYHTHAPGASSMAKCKSCAFLTQHQDRQAR
jgi:hypothetical protein